MYLFIYQNVLIILITLVFDLLRSQQRKTRGWVGYGV
jgi:hypothetical protein